MHCDSEPIQIQTEFKVNAIETERPTCDINPLHALLHRFSRFEKLTRATAWLLRFSSYLKWKYLHKDVTPHKGPLTVTEIKSAELEIIKLVQAESFPREIEHFSKRDNSNATQTDSLRSKYRFSKPLIKCNPFVLDGILRVGGRLMHSDLPLAERHPIILPYDHHITQLIIDLHHRNSGHSGTLYTLASTRKMFWILKGQAAVAKAARRC